jgi:hypothetical protein
MKRKLTAAEIEAKLHRSLSRQVRAPQLDRRFDAGVWARVEAEERVPLRVSSPVAARASGGRWLMVSNVIGIAVATVLVAIFGLRLFSGVNVELSVPNFSIAQNQQLVETIAWAITAATLGFGLMFTPIGRRLRAEFS